MTVCLFLKYSSNMRFDRSGYLLTGKKKGGDGKRLVCDGFRSEYLKAFQSVKQSIMIMYRRPLLTLKDNNLADKDV